MKSKKKLDLKRLSALVFSSCSLQNKLNNIVWPEVLSIMIDAAEKAENDGITLFIVDAALLIEAGFNDFFNSILLITAEKSIRYNRILLRKKIPENQIEKRMALQMAESEKQKQAQTTIKNNGNIQELHTQLELFWKKLNIS